HKIPGIVCSQERIMLSAHLKAGIGLCLYLLILLIPQARPAVLTTSVSPLTDNPQAVLLGDRVNRIAQGLLPFQFTITSAGGTSAPMSLVDLVYCGAEDRTKAKLLAIGHPGPPPQKRPERVLVQGDCSTSLDTIATKALASKDAPDWVASS